MPSLMDFLSLGLAGVRTPDNKKFFDDITPLAVTYYKLDFKSDPSGSKYYRNRLDHNSYCRLGILPHFVAHNIVQHSETCK